MFSILLALVTAPALAVETSNCPNHFAISYRQLIAMSAQRLGEDNSDLQHARHVLLNSRKVSHQNLSFTLQPPSAPGRCEYQGDHTTQAQIFTDGQTDWLRVEIQLEGLIFATQQKVARLAPQRLRLGAEAIVSLYVHTQSQDRRIGWAISPSVTP